MILRKRENPEIIRRLGDIPARLASKYLDLDLLDKLWPVLKLVLITMLGVGCGGESGGGWKGERVVGRAKVTLVLGVSTSLKYYCKTWAWVTTSFPHSWDFRATLRLHAVTFTSSGKLLLSASKIQDNILLQTPSLRIYFLKYSLWSSWRS